MNEEYTAFHEWLISVKSLTKDSADDVVSRIKRAKSIMEIDVPLDIDLYYSILRENPLLRF